MAGRFLQMSARGGNPAYNQSEASITAGAAPSNLVRVVYDDTAKIDDIVICITAIRQELQKRGLNTTGVFVQG